VAEDGNLERVKVRVYGLWFMVYGVGFGVWGLGFGVWGLGSRSGFLRQSQTVKLRISGLESRVKVRVSTAVPNLQPSTLKRGRTKVSDLGA
jgi:hypothetical protein